VAREVATVERLDADGAVVSTVPPGASAEEAHRSTEKPPATAEPAAVNMQPKPLLTPDPVVQQRVRRGLLD
jgi:hypothetical protein